MRSLSRACGLSLFKMQIFLLNFPISRTKFDRKNETNLLQSHLARFFCFRS